MPLGADDQLPPTARLLNHLASGHRTLVKSILPVALRQVTDPADLTDLTLTIANRPERQLKDTVVSALSSPDLRSRLGDDEIVEALSCFVDDDDARLRARVTAVMGALGEPQFDTPAPSRGLWDRQLPQPDLTYSRYSLALAVRELSREKVGELIVEALSWSPEDPYDPYRRIRLYEQGPFAGEVVLGALVRHAWGDPELADWALEVGRTLPSRGVGRLADVDLMRQSNPLRDIFRFAHLLGDDAKTFYAAATPHLVVYSWERLLLAEAVRRLGRAAALLSLPSHLDGSIAEGVLVERLRSWRGDIGALDLTTALLRTGPLPASSLDTLSGIEIDIDARFSPAAAKVQDVASAIRHWSSSPGWPAPTQVLDGLPVELPEQLRIGLSAWRPSWIELHGGGYVVDQIAETAVTLHERWIGANFLSGTLGNMVQSSMPVAVQDGWALLLTDDRHSQGLLAAALTRLDAGTLALPRLVKQWEVLIDAGALRALWPVMSGLAAALVTRKPLPTGTADLLRLMNSVIAEVAEPALPTAIGEFAQRGSSKAAAEAKALQKTGGQRA